MKEAYPELRDSEVFERMKAWLGLEEKLIPFQDDEISKEAYTVWGFSGFEVITFKTVRRVGYKEIENIKTIGDAACALNIVIWNYFEEGHYGTKLFRDTLLMLFNRVPDLKKEFFANLEFLYKNYTNPYIHYNSYDYYDDDQLVVLLDKMSPVMFLGAVDMSFGRYEKEKGKNTFISIGSNIKSME